MDRAKMSIGDLADLVGRDERTVYRWLSGQTPVPAFVKLVFIK
jgi:predicted transcriptional regulator